jgi:hypothetical protein
MWRRWEESEEARLRLGQRIGEYVRLREFTNLGIGISGVL